jgi:hypothetical protein
MLKSLNNGGVALVAASGLVAASVCWIACGSSSSSGGGGPPPVVVPPPPPAIGDWTALAPSVDTRMVYVSSSTGNNANNGLSTATPKATLSAAISLMRNGMPDWLNLKAGDTWTDEDLGNWTISGRSDTEPMVITSYGAGARPFIRSGSGDAMEMFGGTPIAHVFIVGLHFQAHTYTGTGGCAAFKLLANNDDILVEDCYIEGYSDNLVVQGSNPGDITNFRLRRSIIVDSYSTANHSQGIYAENISGLLIEQCLFDHNGWNSGVAGGEETIFNHNMYVQSNCTNVTILGNITAQASSHGLQLRPGGSAIENLFLRNSLAMFAAGEDAGPPQTVVQNNVVLDGKDIDGAPRGAGIEVFDSRNALVKNNIVAHKPPGVGDQHAFWVEGQHDDIGGVPYVIVFEDNIAYQWNGSCLATENTYTALTVQNNILQDLTNSQRVINAATLQGFEVFQNNKYWSNLATSQWFQNGGSTLNLAGWVTASGETGAQAVQVTFPDPDRTIATYMTSQAGTPTLAAFLAEARMQSKSNWRTQYTAPAVNDYIRAGFGR